MLIIQRLQAVLSDYFHIFYPSHMQFSSLFFHIFYYIILVLYNFVNIYTIK